MCNDNLINDKVLSSVNTLTRSASKGTPWSSLTLRVSVIRRLVLKQAYALGILAINARPACVSAPRAGPLRQVVA
jgi:hypothetical protein